MKIIIRKQLSKSGYLFPFLFCLFSLSILSGNALTAFGMGKAKTYRSGYSYQVNHQTYRVISRRSATHYKKNGYASWYGKQFHGRKTALGTIYNMYAMTAASKELPLGTRVRVTNLRNHKSIVVKINDRGPFVKGRIIDLSYGAAMKLGFKDRGVTRVQVETV